jgi:hypothetical protein
VGFTGIMLALPRIYGRGKTQENLSADYFTLVFKKAKERMAASGNALTSQFYSASSSGAGQLRDLLHEAVGQL